MSAHSLATRYAKSLIGLAEEKGKLDEVYNDIKQVDEIFETSRDLKLLFKSPIITSDKKYNVVKKLFEGKIADMLYQFMVLMIRKGREAYLHEVVNAFIVQYNVIRNITPVKITSAVKLDKAFVDRMLESLKKNEKLGEVELTEEVDPTLIGGFVLRYGDKMIDSTISRNLHSLRNIIEDDTYIKKYS